MVKRIESIELWRTGPLELRVGIRREYSFSGYSPSRASVNRLEYILNELAANEFIDEMNLCADTTYLSIKFYLPVEYQSGRKPLQDLIS